MKLFKKKEEDSKDLEEILKEFRELKKEVQELSRKTKTAIQKVGIVRYNPFSNTGSDLSFSIALLDNNNNGIVITSLYTTEENRVYGKPVLKGSSSYSLSKEEEKAIKEAINNGE